MNAGLRNSQKYGPPPGYYDITNSNPPRPLLVEALDNFDGKGKTALDFGCGAGRDTKYLLEKGLKVEAVDGSETARQYIENLYPKNKVRFTHSDFENFEFGKYNLINAAYSLPFINADEFKNVFDRLINSLKPGALFVGQLFGVNDQWNKPEETMVFLTKKEVEFLLKDLEIIKLVEIEEDGFLANDKPKHWHRFDIIARKP